MEVRSKVVILCCSEEASLCYHTLALSEVLSALNAFEESVALADTCVCRRPIFAYKGIVVEQLSACNLEERVVFATTVESVVGKVLGKEQSVIRPKVAWLILNTICYTSTV